MQKRPTKLLVLAISLLLLCACRSVPPRSVEEVREEKAKNFFQKGRKVESEGALGVAILYYTMAIRLKPDLTEAYYYRANNHFDRLEDEEAAGDYTAVLKQLPKHSKARFNRGLAYLSVGDTRKALADFLLLVEQNPKDMEAHKYAGIIYADYADNPQQALYHFQCYLDLGGQDPQVRIWTAAISASEKLPKPKTKANPNEPHDEKTTLPNSKNNREKP